MKQYNFKYFSSLLIKNGFLLDRQNGSHCIFINIQGKHVSVPLKLKCVIAKRLIKENNLIDKDENNSNK